MNFENDRPAVLIFWFWISLDFWRSHQHFGCAFSDSKLMIIRELTFRGFFRGNTRFEAALRVDHGSVLAADCILFDSRKQYLFDDSAPQVIAVFLG